MKIRIIEDMEIDGQMRRSGDVVDTDEETVKFLIHVGKARAVTTPDLTPTYPNPSLKGGKEGGRVRVKRAGVEAETAAMEGWEER